MLDPLESAVDTKIRLCEIFGPTIQGEGALIGKPTIFVRSGGCDYRCVWCDSLYAVDSAFRFDWFALEPVAVMAKIENLSGGIPLMISLSGGNPALQPFGDLITLGKTLGYSFAMETQGSLAKPWFQDLDVLVLSPKPPSSGMTTDLEKLQNCVTAAGRQTEISLKIVLFNEADYRFARSIAASFPKLPIYLQPGNPTPAHAPAHANPGSVDLEDPLDFEALAQRYDWLVTQTLKDHWYDVTILPQLHVMIWGNRRGV